MAMQIEFLELTDTKATFVISGTAPYFVNALRRTLIADVPKMAIEDVEFHLGPIRDASGKEFESIFPIFDEMVAHRIGLLPIPTDLDVFTFREKCKCGGEGCPSCRIMYKLNKMGPCTVYSGDLEPLDDPKLAVKDDLIPIVKLTDGQAPLIYATAYLGTSSMHAKWQTCSGVGYRYMPIVDIDNKKCNGDGKCVEKCPAQILKMDKKKVFLVDTRPTDNFEKGHIEGSRHIDLEDIHEALQILPKDKKIVLIDHKGKTTLVAGRYLAFKGYKDLTRLDGGINAWSKDGNPIVLSR